MRININLTSLLTTVLKICPRCGATSDRKKFIGAFCEDCFAERIKIEIPRSITYQLCKTCGRIRTDKWEHLSKRALEKPVLKEIKGKYTNVRFIFPDSGDGTASAVFLVQAGDSFVEIPKQFGLVQKKTQCEDCSRSSSGYFESIIQLRGDEKRVAKLKDSLVRSLQRKTFVSRIEEQKHGGFDLYIGSNKETLALIEELGLRAEITYTLHGVKEGNRIYRTTYCIRL